MLLSVLAAAYASVCATLFAYQDSLIYYPQTRALGSAHSTLVLPTNGAELMVTVRAHPGPNAIIYFGGNAEDVSLNLPAFDQAFPGHAVYLLHYRAYGGSSGTPSEGANHQDALALYEHVRAQHPNVVVIGRSLGSGIAVRLASQQAVSRLILVTPYDSLQEIAAARFPLFPVRWLLRDKYNAGSFAPAVTAPTRILAAEQDDIIPRASTEALLGHFTKGVASMQTLPGTGHNTISGSPDYLTELQKFLL